MTQTTVQDNPSPRPSPRFSAYVFVSCYQPRRVREALRQLPGVTKADVLMGSGEVALVIEEHSFASLQVRLSEVQATPGVKRLSVKLAA
ncbi:hypothetical protein [Calidithermus timidus]|jgi:hypothetical protein|uniref:hypothetical protein n=1 Tax=Calidithermus timidus TaxID=307124 RepID=UPI00037B584B|nr:hypothetical protein [Calidithermus timidus]